MSSTRELADTVMSLLADSLLHATCRGPLALDSRAVLDRRFAQELFSIGTAAQAVDFLVSLARQSPLEVWPQALRIYRTRVIAYSNRLTLRSGPLREYPILVQREERHSSCQARPSNGYSTMVSLR